MQPRFFASPAQFREWLAQHHGSAPELLVGFYKKHSGRPSITWPGAVDAALCFGWIDGIRKRLDEASYTIRFTPRKPRSTWSAINIKRVRQLTELGLMQPSGLQAFERRKAEDSGKYSYEQRRTARLTRACEQRFRANQKAWEFFQRQTPWYRRVASFWVVSAKKEETRLRRLVCLIEDSAAGRTIRPLTRAKPR